MKLDLVDDIRSARRSFILTFTLTLLASLYFLWQSMTGPVVRPAGFLAADKGYGVTIDLTQYDDEALAGVLSSLRENGLLWLRQPVRWADLEPAPGKFDWQPLDRIFAAIARNNEQSAATKEKAFKLIAVLETSPVWARAPHAPQTAPPVQLAEFGRFSRAFAARYGRKLDHYQIWHEPNLSANWGNSYIDPAGYAGLLREAAYNIRDADPDALLLTAALAPTLEHNELNLDEMAYLDRLYRLKANQWFDIVAGQPYGFDFDPADPARPDRLNFRRLELLRRVMLAHDDANTPIWATAFGWNVLPPGWTGRPSPWRSDQERYDPPSLQIERIAAALEQARRDWPWLGPMLAIRWDTVGLAADDPARGFALQAAPAMLAAFREAAAQAPVASPGLYPADHSSGRYSPGWRFSSAAADIPHTSSPRLTVPFEGTGIDLIVNRGLYRGYLWATIDGQPANALPQDKRGRSYVVLYDPLRESEIVTLAQDLPPGRHELIIEADGGWSQWAISGWIVYHRPDRRISQAGLLLIILLAISSGLGLAWQLLPQLAGLFRLIALHAKTSTARYLALNEYIQGLITFSLAVAFILAPDWLALPLQLPLTIAILLRPDLGLMLVTFTISFFHLSRPLPSGSLYPLETLLLLSSLGFSLRRLTTSHYQPTASHPSSPQSPIPNPQSLDLPAIALLLLAYLATLAAPNFGVSMREWRLVVAESILFYFLVRLGRDYSAFQSKTPLGWAWRLTDALVAGAACHALLALSFYIFADQAILAEGVRRAVGPLYSSPNNLALFLGRVWPILLAVAFFPIPSQVAVANGGAPSVRRRLYGAAFLVVSLTLFLTFSKGALLLGLPTAMLVMALLHLWRHRQAYRRRLAAVTAGTFLLISLALSLFSQTGRFQTIFDLSQGSTGFFRLKLWQAALNMLQDHWLLGLGLDNFLYEYRTRYILPEAWQEPNLSHPHNLILDFGTRLGVGGILLLFWLQISFWRTAWRLYQKLPHPLILGLMGSMAVFLSHGLVDHSYFLVDLAFTFFLTAGLIQRLADE